ncbi:MAG: PAS domain S-box protein [Desulfobacula sp.]|jgi:PAS domain S-box-containing protein
MTQEVHKICPISGLPVISRPEWVYEGKKNGFKVEVFLIGGRILHIKAQGVVNIDDQVNSINLQDRVARTAIGENEPFIQIQDWENFKGASNESRQYYIDYLKNNDRVTGVIFCHTSFMFRMSIKLGKRLNMVPFPIYIADDYAGAVKTAQELMENMKIQDAAEKSEKKDFPLQFVSDEPDFGRSVCKILNTNKQAVTEAVAVLRKNCVQVDTLDFSKQRFSKNNWKIEMGAYRISFEIIGEDIIYSEPHGILKEDYIDDIFALHERVIREAGFENGKPYFRILNWTNFESSSLRARKLFVRKTNELQELYPCAFSVIFGMNPFMTLMINISKAFLPFKVFAAKDIHEALEIIEEKQAALKNKPVEVEEEGSDNNFDIRMETFKAQLLNYMGTLDWDQKGIGDQNIEDGHPFKEVFDALSIIKADLDSVFEERDEAETRLRQSEERYRNILENIDDGYYEVDLEGNFLFFNETLLKLMGYSHEEFSSMNYRQVIDQKTADNVFKVFKKVYESGIPKTDLGYELIGKDGRELYGETSISLRYGVDGKICGFRGIVRDRTEKKALEDELIRHRDSLEKMITQRTLELEEETVQKNYAKKINTSIFNISTADNTTQSLDELYPLIHHYLNEIVEMPNFYIGIYDRDRDVIIVPYHADQYDEHITEIPDISTRSSLSSEVVLSQKPLFLKKQSLMDRSKSKKMVGHIPENWIGVPLVSQDRTIGIMTAQSYTDPDHFSIRDLEVLISVSNQVALAIERREALDDLHEREEKYRRLIETTSAGYWQADEKDVAVEVNQAFCDMIGYDPNEIIGKSASAFFENQSAEDYEKLMVQSTKTSDRSYEATFVKKNGQLLYTKIDATSILDEEGCFKGSFAFITDISDRIRSQEELHRAKERAEEASETTLAIMENLQAGVVLIHAKTHRINLINPAAARMFGSTPENIVGNRCYNFLCPKKEGQCPITDLKEQIDNSEKYMLNIRGEKIPILKTVSQVVLNGESFLLESFVDITEQKKAEADLINETRRANELAKAAEAASQAKSEFMANMSHEIRTPINGVIGMAEILMDSPLTDGQKNYIQTISSEADALLNIINSVLDFSKIEAGKMELEEIDFDLRKIFEDLSAIFSIQANRKGLDFFSFLDPEIPSCLKGDPGKLRQIFMNLVGNALKFTSQGEIFLTGKKISETEDKISICFEIKDTGIGIPSEKHDSIFDSFSQADGSTTRKYGGTGLGTTISKQLVELMGGKIGLESKEGEGSNFWFVVEFIPQAMKKSVDQGIVVDLKGLLILVVDTNPTHQYIISKYLDAFGCKSVSANTIDEALKILEQSGSQKRIDLIITDFNSGKTDGFEFAEKIRREKTWDKVPVILLTSMGMAGDAKRCRDAGIDGYLPKPVRKKELERIIAGVLGMIDQPDSDDRHLITKHSIEESVRKNITVLVAEDYPTNQQIALKHLSSAGFHAVLAENGIQAVEQFKKIQFDLIFMDIQMPEMDGYEATQKIREIEKHISGNLTNRPFRTPLIAMTAHAMKGYREKCIEADMDDYLTKPLKRKDLIAMVEKWVPSHKAMQSTIPEKGNEIITQTSSLPMDIPKALEEFENDEDFLNDVVAEFLDNVGHQIDIIRSAIAAKDFETIQKQGHAIKGGAANLTAMKLSEAAFTLEKKGEERVPDHLGVALTRLVSEYETLCRFIEQVGLIQEKP